jgi:hypothetical protein
MEFARDLNPDLYLARLAGILPEDPSTGESWLPPLAYGLLRDFANQRRAIRADLGALRADFSAAPSQQEIGLTESYMDQGNWTLARHYGNQARNALIDSLNPATVGPLVSGQFEAFLLMSRRDPAAVLQLEALLTDFPEGKEETELLLLRTLIDQGELDRALDLVNQALTEPSQLDPATVLFLPPFEKLHGHPAFRATLSPHVGEEKLDAALAWLAER